MIRECVSSEPEEINLLDTWYKKDENSVPPVCILQPISSILTNFNNKVFVFAYLRPISTFITKYAATMY